jgi:hypothetical protein
MIEVGFGDVDDHESFILARYNLPQNLKKIALSRVPQKFILVVTRHQIEPVAKSPSGVIKSSRVHKNVLFEYRIIEEEIRRGGKACLVG